MRFIVALAISLALVWLCAKPLKKYPVPFYIGAIVLVGLYFWGVEANVHNELWSFFQPLMQRCALAFLLFSIVMFVGVLSEKSPLRTHLMPIRRQLSILACIFAVGHVVFYGSSYIARISTAFSTNLAFSLTLAVVITILMAILGVTSFKVIKHSMSASTWKGIQRLAYAFYLLIYAHLALLLAPSALAGNDVAILSIVVYTVVVGAYIVLRSRKAIADRSSNETDSPALEDLETATA